MWENRDRKTPNMDTFYAVLILIHVYPITQNENNTHTTHTSLHPWLFTVYLMTYVFVAIDYDLNVLSENKSKFIEQSDNKGLFGCICLVNKCFNFFKVISNKRTE